jgi:predicted nucleic acid-binding protein
VAIFLADTSIWAWARKGTRPDIELKLADRIDRDELATCVPVALEVMHRARDGDEYEAIYSGLLEPVRWLPVDDRAASRALAVQRRMAAGSSGNHLRPAVDYLVASVAEAAGSEVVLWGFDRDLRLICEHTGQPYEDDQVA